MTQSERWHVQGSERAEVKGGRVVARVADEETIDVTVRLRAAWGLAALHAAAGVPITRAELAQRHGASPQDVRDVESFAHAHGLTVLDARPEERAVQLRGSARALQDAFGVLLERVEHPGGGTFRQRTGHVQIPAHIAHIVTGVFGLDDRPQARPYVRAASVQADASSPAGAGAQPGFYPGTFSVPQVAQVYGFPGGVTGQGQTIALIEMSGGYQPADLQAYAARLGIPAIQVVAVSVDGGHNAPNIDPNADGEVAMDIEVAAAVAPGARIAVYFAPNTDRGFIDAVSAAVHDTQRSPDVISISWGSAENTWTQQAVMAFDEVLQAAAAIGVPVFAAAGDQGAADSEPGVHVNYPASSPYAIGCGGTSLTVSQDFRYQETVWNDADGATGGGYSSLYPAPPFQAPWTGTWSARGVPDLAANADPQTGYQLRVNGADVVLGGTSAVAPLLAGLTALCNHGAGYRPGVLLPRLYAAGSPSGAYFDVVQGNNGGFSAGPGWDPCTGLGVPWGTAFAALGWGVPS